MSTKFVVVTGPTCSGKTALSLKLAKKFDAELVSADSRQVYKLMDIGTGKIPRGSFTVDRFEDRLVIDGITIWGVDLITPDKLFSAFDFVEYVKSLNFQKQLVIICGGTGFYIDALFGNITMSGVSPDLPLRKELEKFSTEELFEKLKLIDNERAGRIDKRNKVRLIRALEIAGEASSFEEDTQVSYPKLKSEIQIGLTAPRSVLYDRADRWVSEIIQEGLVEETRRLLSEGYGGEQPLNGLLYKSVKDYLVGNISDSELYDRCRFSMHAYIRRQETYFTRLKDVSWFDITKNSFDTTISTLVESKLNE